MAHSLHKYTANAVASMTVEHDVQLKQMIKLLLIVAGAKNASSTMNLFCTKSQQVAIKQNCANQHQRRSCG